MLPLPASSIAVPPLPMMAPASKMLNPCMLSTSMPIVPAIVPVLLTPPAKVLMLSS